MICQLWQGTPDRNILDFFRKNEPIVEVWLIQLFYHLVDKNYHEGAHVLLKLESFKSHSYAQCPELQKIRRSLLLLGGQQAMEQRQTDCACQIWKPLISAKGDFDPQLVYNYTVALEEEEQHNTRFQMLKQLQQWIQKDAKQNPDRWPESYLKTTLAHLHCLIADALAVQSKSNAARQEVSLAVRLAPDCPEVWVRQGYMAHADEENLKAIDFFTRGLEAGIKDEDVYLLLILLLKKEGQIEELNRIKKLFAKDYEDEVIPTVDIPEWIYLGMGDGIQSMERIIESRKNTLQKNPLGAGLLPLYNTFMRYKDENYLQKRLSVNLKSLQRDFNTVLETIAPEYQVKALQIIILYLAKFVTRQKGIAGVVNFYLDQLEKRGKSDPEAHFAYIAMLAIKNVAKSTLDKVLVPYLNQSIQPHQALADLQFHVRYFVTTKAFLPAINQALAKDSQNPLLLLAKATTFPHSSPDYKQFREQSFELARRLQDQRALERLREEDALINQSPSSMDFKFNKFMDLMLEEMSNQDFSIDQFLNSILGEDDDEYEDDEYEDEEGFEMPSFPSIFPFPRPNQRESTSKSRSTSKSKKGGFG